MAIEFVDLQAQRARLGTKIDNALQSVLEHGRFIMGPEVGALESQLAARAGSAHCLTCSSGTDALALVLLGWGIGPNDAVFVPSFTFVASAEVVSLVGATPVLVDVEEESFNLCPESLSLAIDVAVSQGLTPKGAMTVDLFGQPADYDRLLPLAREHGLKVLCDAAQSFGAAYGGTAVGSIGDATATSFFPAKPLGCYGDGGAVFTDDPALAEAIDSLRIHGKGQSKYDNVRIGLNARLDTLQAAILLEKLAVFSEEIDARQRVAERYSRSLHNSAVTPRIQTGSTSVWAQYTLRLPDRDAVADYCKEHGVPTAVYYPTPLTQQTAYRQYPAPAQGTPVAERLSKEVLSIPMHPYLAPSDQDYIIEVLRNAAQR